MLFIYCCRCCHDNQYHAMLCHVREPACAEAARSRFHLVATLHRSPLGRSPGRLQLCAQLPTGDTAQASSGQVSRQTAALCSTPYTVGVHGHLLQPAGLWTSSPSALLSRLLHLRKESDHDKSGLHYWSEPHEQSTYDASNESQILWH